MKIRKYENKDLTQIIQLFYDTVHTVNAKDYSSLQLDAWAVKEPDIAAWEKRLHGEFILVAEQNGQIVGFGTLTNTGVIDHLFTHKDHQEKGIAGSILQKLEEEAKRRCLGIVKTEASRTAKPFFEKQGYIVLYSQLKPCRGLTLQNFVMQKILT